VSAVNITRSAVALVVAAILTTATGCGTQMPSTKTLTSLSNGTVLAPLASGSLRYVDQTSGAIADIDGDGNRLPSPVRGPDNIIRSYGNAVLGLTVAHLGETADEQTYASWIDSSGRFTVGMLTSDKPKLLWRGPIVAGIGNVGGTLTVTPAQRVLVSVGDLGAHDAANDDKSFNGKIITLDPTRGADQQPNVISKGWTNPRALAYTDDLLWVADRGPDGKDLLGRAGPNGFTGTTTALGENTQPAGLTRYGDKELVLCSAATHELRRFLVDSAQAVTGRLLASDCNGPVAELADARIVYGATNELRITAR
jgi:hypothetical protein